MAGHNYGNRIGPIGRSDRAHGFRTPDQVGDLGIGARLAVRDTIKFFPDGYLECGAAQIERAGELYSLSREITL